MITESVKIGSTGRTDANSLFEQLAMKQVKSNPLEYSYPISKISMHDSRWPAADGWIKMEAIIYSSDGKTKATIHFVYNTSQNLFDDF